MRVKVEEFTEKLEEKYEDCDVQCIKEINLYTTS